MLKTIYSLIWDDFCSWYLEWVKPGFEQPIHPSVYEKTVDFFEQLMQLLHPFLPFVTEEIYHQLRERPDDLVVRLYPATGTAALPLLQNGQLLKDVITGIRDARVKAQLKPKETIRLSILAEKEDAFKSFESILQKQVNAESITYTGSPVANSIALVIGKDKFFIETTTPLDTTAQREQLEKDLLYYQGFLEAVERKLSNEKFVNNAKAEIVDAERKKKADAEAKIQAIEESLRQLNP